MTTTTQAPEVTVRETIIDGVAAYVASVEPDAMDLLARYSAEAAKEDGMEYYLRTRGLLPDGLPAQRDDRGSDSWCNRHGRIPWAADGICGPCETSYEGEHAG